MSQKTDEEVLRAQLVITMSGREAHIDFETAIDDFPVHARGLKPDGAPHSAWQLLEHMRIAQNDILEFSRNPEHESPKWPEGYWPKTEAPPRPEDWDASVAAFERDAREMKELTQNPSSRLFDPLPHGEGQTLLREALLVASHNSYHLGQLVFLKRMIMERD